jgi:hypothetical protein
VAEFTEGDAHTLEELAAKAGKWHDNKDEEDEVNVAGALSSREAAEEYSPRRKPWRPATEIEQAPEGRKSIAHAHPECALETTVPAPQTDNGVNDTLQPLLELFIHPRKLLPQMPAVTADELTVARIRDGRPINLFELSRARQVKVFSSQRDLIAIATRVAGTLFHPKIVFVITP